MSKKDPEKELWNVVRRKMGNLWRAQRIEDSISSDIPDVFFSVPRNGQRVSGMIELKCQEPTKQGKLNARHYTQGQRDFAALHQAVFLLLYSDGWFMLFDHTKSDEILRGQSFKWHTEQAIYASDDPCWITVAALLCQRVID